MIKTTAAAFLTIIFTAYGNFGGLFDGTASSAAAWAQQRAAPTDERPWRYDKERARDVIEAHGYYNVQGLVQNHVGTWRGTATRYGRTMIVDVTQKGFFDEYPLAAGAGR
ncbi:MAG: hypothetical protein RLN70_00025 [Rhodospirillaceae bacterium]